MQAVNFFSRPLNLSYKPRLLGGGVCMVGRKAYKDQHEPSLK